jgi:hypothetical protein
MEPQILTHRVGGVRKTVSWNDSRFMARPATKLRVQATVSGGASKQEVRRWVKATKLLFELQKRKEDKLATESKHLLS